MEQSVLFDSDESAVVPDSPVKPVWSRMDLAEFHKAGLLWRVNEAVLWPLGLALSVQIEEDGSYSGLFVQRVDPTDPIWSGATPEEQEDYLDRFAVWVRQRMAH